MFWNSIRNIFVNDIGIDLGTMNTLVCTASDGVVLEEPSFVAINADSKRVRAVGNEAKRMAGVTPERIKVIRPMRDGVIADAAVTDEMLRIFIRKCTSHFKIMQPRVLIAVPSGITEVGQRAVRESALRGVRCIVIYEKKTTGEVKRYEVIPTEYAYRRNKEGAIRKVLWVQDCNDGSDHRQIKCFYVRNIKKAAVTRRRVKPKWPILIV